MCTNNNLSEHAKKSLHKYINLNEEQIKVIDEFTKFKSASILEQEMARNIGDSDFLKDFSYFGYIDTKFFGGGKCSLGHVLRYIHFAKNKETGEVIQFGIKCITDFFNITPIQLKLLKDGFKQTNSLVNEIIEKVNKNDYDFSIYDKFNELITIIQDHKAIKKLIEVKLPLPYIYEKEINNAYKKQMNDKDFKKFLSQNPNLSTIIITAKFLKDTLKNKPNIYKPVNDILNFLDRNKYLSEKQINLLNKLINVNYKKIDKLIEEINSIKYKLSTAVFNELGIFENLVESYNNYGLTEKQIGLLQKIRNRHKKELEKITI